MTVKLYYENPYSKECEANVVEVIEKEGKTLVILDKTLFYPEGGGQPTDLGEIDGIRVLYVYEKNGIIYHEVEKAPERRRVFCKIDFNRRFDHMQQHSGEHLLSGAILKLFGGNNKGFHLGDDYVTIDIDIPNMSEEMIKAAEDEVNNYIFKNEDIRTCIVSKEESLKFHIRKQVNVDEDIRIVEAKDMDCCACCGTHVLKTGEIGIIKITKTERYKGMTRIYFKCGKRALIDFQNKNEIISKIIRHFSTEENIVIERIENQSKELESLRKKLDKLYKKFAELEAEEIINNETSSVILRNYSDKSFDEVQLVASALNNYSKVLILSSLMDRKVLLLNNSELDINCGKIFKENIREFSGKGGGNATRAQGTFDSQEAVIKFSDFLMTLIKQ